MTRTKFAKRYMRAGLTSLAFALLVVTGVTGLAQSVRAETEQATLFRVSPAPYTPCDHVGKY